MTGDRPENVCGPAKEARPTKEWGKLTANVGATNQSPAPSRANGTVSAVTVTFSVPVETPKTVL
jgi:hypothetical protein